MLNYELNDGLHRRRAARPDFLLPESVEDYVGENNPVRFIDGFVDQLDLAECGFIKERKLQAGRPGYDPSDLLKLYLYCYSNRTRSSRMLERAVISTLKSSG